MRKAVVGGLVALLLTGCIAPPSQPVGRREAELVKASLEDVFARDLQFIYEEIRDNYVNLPCKEQLLGFDWDELYAHYAARLEEVETQKDFFLLASAFVSELRDGHAALYPYRGRPEVEQELYDFDPALKSLFAVRLIEGSPIIVESALPFPLVGAEILAINGINFLELVEAASRHFFYGATDRAAVERVMVDQYFLNYLALVSGPFPGQLEIVFRSSDGRLGSFTLNAHQPYAPDQPEPAQPLDPLPELAIEEGIALIRVPTFDVSSKEFGARLKAIEQELKTAGVQGVVLDLRGNGGGNESFRELLAYLVREETVVAAYRYRESPRFQEIYRLRPLYDLLLGRRRRGEREPGYSSWYHWTVQPKGEGVLRSLPAAVLVDRLVFSSADRFVGAVLEHDLAVVVGTEIALSGHGLSTPVLLPSGNYVLRYGFQELRDAQFAHLENQVREPHLFAEQTLADYHQGVDTALAQAVAWLQVQGQRVSRSTGSGVQ